MLELEVKGEEVNVFYTVPNQEICLCFDTMVEGLDVINLGGGEIYMHWDGRDVYVPKAGENHNMEVILPNMSSEIRTKVLINELHVISDKAVRVQVKSLRR